MDGFFQTLRGNTASIVMCRPIDGEKGVEGMIGRMSDGKPEGVSVFEKDMKRLEEFCTVETDEELDGLVTG